jgi:hypothetical protein
MEIKNKLFLLSALLAIDIVVGIIFIFTKYTKIDAHPEWSADQRILVLYAIPFLVIAIILVALIIFYLFSLKRGM